MGAIFLVVLLQILSGWPGGVQLDKNGTSGRGFGPKANEVLEAQAFPRSLSATTEMGSFSAASFS